MIDLKEYLSVQMIDLMGEQIAFYRDHLDIFIEDYYGYKLKDQQKIIARMVGRGSRISVANSRGSGKTWLLALCAHAICILWPGSFVAVVSGTANQDTLILEKLQQMTSNPAIVRELNTSSGRNPVQVNANKGKTKFLNDSEIESYSIRSIRGRRAKMIIVDEAPLVKSSDLDSAVGPVRNFTRDVCHTYGIRDYRSKVINISSACEKSNHFYEDIMQIARGMSNGNKDLFAMTLDYRAAVRAGITDLDYFEGEKHKMPQSKFDMEYGTIFLGEEANSMFPYSVTEACRTFKDIELMMPKSSTSSYVMGVDIATSSAKTADNTVITVIKLFEHQDGSIGMKLVFMRSFHGQSLPALAREVRKIYTKFPNITKIVFDQRGLGDSFPKFMDEPWVDPDSGKEYPPFVVDDERAMSAVALPILRSVKANQGINQAMATGLRVALEQRKLELPVSSRNIINGKLMMSNGDDESEDATSLKTLSMAEQAVFIETDALQFEMGNVVAIRTQAGNFIYDTARKTQHKDRYSSIAMAVWFIAEMEAMKKRRYYANMNCDAIGVATRF